MIRILDKNVADKIAAGEVIDRPVSIVKELMENSLDAGADNITVEIKNGGKSYIRVTDNGCGIDDAEAEMAFRRHATSKIRSAADLNAIETLGFRGEALASICAVARVELVTKTPEAKAGRKVVVEGSDVTESKAVGCPDGTTVTVRDLFYNVPARQKFLATDSSETRRITDMVSKIALAYGDVKIRFINGGKNVFTTGGSGNIYNNIINIYGNDIGKDLLGVEASSNGFMIKGFVSPPSDSAPSRNRQIFCVNGRVVASKVMEMALEEAYKEKLFKGRYPIAFLFMYVPPEKVDVNVHPTKKEVRFDDIYEVHDFIKNAVSRALQRVESMPQMRSDKSFTVEEETYAYNEEEKKTDPSPESSEREEQVDVKSLLSNLRKETDEKQETAEDDTGSSVKEESPFDFNDLDLIGVLFDTYIIASDEDSFYMIDQHAAHERIFYEKLLSQLKRRERASQQLLVPMQFSVAANVTGLEDTWIDELRSIGYDVEFFGNNTYLVREIPAFMTDAEAGSFLSDFFKGLEDKPDLTDKNTLDRIIKQSCKNAVKGGDVLDDREIKALIGALSQCDNPFSCPHGRPTFVRMTKYQVEKLFKRV